MPPATPSHVLPGLMTHEGPILTVANWSGTWPGLVGMLNLNGSLAKAGVPMFAIHGDVDVIVPMNKNSGEMKKRYEALGGRMDLIVPPGQGHNYWEGFFQCRELVDFVIKAAYSSVGRGRPK